MNFHIYYDNISKNEKLFSKSDEDRFYPPLEVYIMDENKNKSNPKQPGMKKVAPPPMNGAMKEKDSATLPEKKEVKAPEKKEVKAPEKKEVKAPEKKEVKAPEKKEAAPVAPEAPAQKAEGEKVTTSPAGAKTAKIAEIFNKIKAAVLSIPIPDSVKQKIIDNKPMIKKFAPVLIGVVVISVGAAVALNHYKFYNKEEVPLGPVYATDENGVAITDENGVAITITPETEVVKVTDENGKVVRDSRGRALTTIIYKEYNYTHKTNVTDKDGNDVTDKDGNKVTENVTLKQDANKQQGGLVMGTTAVVVTDGKGHTAVDQNGNVLTTIAKLTSNPVTVNPAEIDWKASMGGTEADYFSAIDSVKDGYIAINVTNSKNGNMSEYADLKIATPFSVICKYNESGKIEWRKAIGSAKGLHVFTDVITLDDGSFYAVGYAKNASGKAGKGYYDGVVYKYDKKGNELWHEVFGTSTVDIFNAATLTKDGGIVVVGSVGNNDEDAAGFKKPELESAACIVKYSASGELVWKNIVGGNKDSFKGVVETKKGNIVCVGNFGSNVLFKNLGKTDSGVVRFNSKGKYISTTPIQGKNTDFFTGITACKDGGVVVVGRSNSSDTNGAKSMFTSELASRGGYDAYIMKFNEDLNLLFAKPFRGQYDDDLVDIKEKADGSFVATGCSNSSTRDFKGITTRGGDDIVIASFDKNGNLTWARSFGGTANESANAICLSKKKGYVIAGSTLSKNIDMVGIAQYVNGKSVGVLAKFPE